MICDSFLVWNELDLMNLRALVKLKIPERRRLLRSLLSQAHPRHNFVFGWHELVLPG